MSCDRYGNLTDDADRMVGGCDTFDCDGVGDRDPMYDDAPGDGPKCGGPVYEYGQNTGCGGCRHCDPPDRECKPYGWGIERFEDPALERANAAMWAEIDKRGGHKYTGARHETWGMHAGRALVGPRALECDRAFRNMLLAHWSTHDAKLHTRSERLWDRLCDRCETHGEALAKYSAWAEKATGRKRKKA